LLGQPLIKKTNRNYLNQISNCINNLTKNQFFKTLIKKRIILKKFVDGKFQPIILGCILINTLSMAIEHHDEVLINNLINLYLILIFCYIT
jgi:hypothetical protein